jgi:hypothetical protein
MSEALKSMTPKQTRTGQAPAGVGATLAYNMIIKDVLPPIVAELEKKIAGLQQQLDTMKPPAGAGLSAVRALQGGRTRRRSRR